ncbi:MAG TPA: oligopeptide:H+ symporter [Rhodanobacteraceae bacterium]|nr:oligopeptide:H+ symporter [Rhodanobacteraceae bacterium]
MSTESAAANPHADPSDRWGHPRSLWMLLGVTVGLNFAFYGFRSFVAPYLAQTFFANLPTGEALRDANLLTAGVGALLYATHVFGGWIADNVLGEARALRTALWLEALALALMAWPTRPVFVLALAVYVLGAGLSIPLTVLIGRNYGTDDPRRDAGYTLFYLAINLGAFVAPFVCADWIGGHFGYRYGFLAASAGVALSALLFQLRCGPLEARQPPARYGGPRALPAVLLGMLALLYPTMLLLEHSQLLGSAVYLLLGLLVLYFIVSSLRRGDRVQTQRYIAMLLLFAANIVFWALSLQGATSLNFFARDYVSAPFNFALFQSANPLFILMFAPVMAVLWPWLDRRAINPSTPRKFGIGLLLVALSYGVVAYAVHHLTGADGRVSWLILALCYLLQTIGELALSPIGYAMVTRLAAPDESSLAMGGWFFGIAMAYSLSGVIAARTTTGSAAGIAGYAHVYGQLFVWGLLVSALYLLAAPLITRLMHGAR